MNELTTKTCIKCGEEKPPETFRTHKEKKRNVCRPCENAARRIYLANTPEAAERKKASDRARERAGLKRAAVIKYQKTTKYIVKYLARLEKGKQATISRDKGRFCVIHPITCACCGVQSIQRKDLSDKPINRRFCRACAKKNSTTNAVLPRIDRICGDCGIKYIGMKQSRRCSACGKKNQKSYSKGRMRGRVSRAGVYRETVNKAKVYKRDRYRCAYCKCKVVLSASYRPDMATLDHIIPLCRGGEHTYSNIVTACIMCNSTKGNRVPDGTQISLFSVVKEL